MRLDEGIDPAAALSRKDQPSCDRLEGVSGLVSMTVPFDFVVQYGEDCDTFVPAGRGHHGYNCST